MLTYAEEILLLALDDRTGAIKPLPEQALRFALTGALLLQLAMTNRIDTDLNGLHVIDAAPTGDPLLDDALTRLSAGSPVRTTTEWLNTLAWEIPDLQGQIVDRLVGKGVLRIEDRRILWVFATRRYPMLDDREVKEVSARLRELIDSEEIPDPDEAALIALVDACQLFDGLFSQEDLVRLRPRIAALTRLDLIGREVARSVEEVSNAVASAMPTIM